MREIRSLDEARRQQELYADGPLREPTGSAPHEQWTKLDGGKGQGNILNTYSPKDQKNIERLARQLQNVYRRQNGPDSNIETYSEADMNRYLRGASPGDDEKKGWWGMLKDYWHEVTKENPPVKDVSALGRFVYYGGISYLLNKMTPGQIQDESTMRRMMRLMVGSWSKAYDQKSEGEFLNFSPMMRQLLVLSGGKTDIESIYTYTFEDYKVPIFIKMYDKEGPTKAQLEKGIEDVERDRVSPFDKMEEGTSRGIISDGFLRIAANLYTGGAFREWYEHEPSTFLRAFVKEDTKGDWPHDYDAENEIDAELQGKVEVYRRPVSDSGFWYKAGKFILNDGRRRSGTALKQNIMGSIGQDISYYAFGGAGVARFLKDIGLEDDGIRLMLHGYFKIGSRVAETLGAGGRQFTYDVGGRRAEESALAA